MKFFINKRMRGWLVVVFLCGIAVWQIAGSVEPAPEPEEFWLGADISATTHLESQGIYSYDKDGVRTENTLLMKKLGLNAVRLRVWVDPKGGWSSKEDVLEMARRAKRHDMAILICFHYSDWWADPGKQHLPAAWVGLDYEGVKQALVQHTVETLQLLKEHDIAVKWVQVGNETTNGMLWPVGHRDNMAQYAGLTDAGYAAVKSVYPEAQVIVHLDNGFDAAMYNAMFDALREHGARWDMIGMSVYPYWAMQGGREPDAASTLRHSIENVEQLVERYGCDVMIVETGVEAAEPDEGYAFLSQLIEAARNVSGHRCKGVFYWAPECCHGGYSLGAFQNDRPTRIMDAFTEAAIAIKGSEQDSTYSE